MNDAGDAPTDQTMHYVGIVLHCISDSTDCQHSIGGFDTTAGFFAGI